MILVCLVVTVLYCLIVIGFLIGSYRVQEFNSDDSEHKQHFSIIIPFRNEENQLPNLIKSLQQLNYPSTHYELLFVDDASTDKSMNILNEFKGSHPSNVVILPSIRVSSSPKKDALVTAIKTANFDWILTTDADCQVPNDWLNALSDFIHKYSCDLIAAPVYLRSKNTFLESFQALDILSLQGVTMGAFGLNQAFLCNGANLCYRKEVFYALKGFQDNSNIASGDDVFLLQKVTQSQEFKAGYLKSLGAAVSAAAEPNWKALFQQRKRWAAKTSSYQQLFSKLVAISVLAMNLQLILLLAFSILKLFSWDYLFFLFVAKLIVDLLLLIKTAAFFKQYRPLRWYLLSGMLYPFFSMFVALSSLFTPYQWKGRTFKK